MISPFITHLAIGIMLIVSSVTLFFVAVIVVEKVIRFKPVEWVRGKVGGERK